MVDQRTEREYKAEFMLAIAGAVLASGGAGIFLGNLLFTWAWL